MFQRIPRRMPFLGAGTAVPCVGGRRVGFFPVIGPGGKTGGVRRKRFLAIIGAGFYRLRPPGPRPLRAKAAQGKPARRPSHDYGWFFVETVPKGTRLVQVQLVNGFGVVGTGAKTAVLRQTHYLQALTSVDAERRPPSIPTGNSWCCGGPR